MKFREYIPYIAFACVLLSILIIGTGLRSAISEANSGAGRISDFTYADKAMRHIHTFSHEEAARWDMQDHKYCLANAREWLTRGGEFDIAYAQCRVNASNVRILYMLGRGCIGVRAHTCTGMDELIESRP